MLNNSFFFILTASFIIGVSTSCKDAEIDQVMTDYCECINSNKNNPEGRYECIQLMDSIQEVYSNQPRKLNKVIEKAGECW